MFDAAKVATSGVVWRRSGTLRFGHRSVAKDDCFVKPRRLPFRLGGSIRLAPTAGAVKSDATRCNLRWPKIALRTIA